jgi:uncharacterized DUF497 family protein
MIYEWDKTKSQANLEKHGLTFEDAEAVFEGNVITVADQRKDYGEPRFASLGTLCERIVFIAHTARAGKVCIISMRKANEREQKIYQERLAAHRRDE